MNIQKENKNILNKITLNFPDEREKEYRDYYFDRSYKTTRIAFVVLAVMYGFFGYLDSIIAGDFFQFFISIRIIVVSLLLFVFFLSYTKNFKNYWQILMFIAYFIGSLGIIVMLIRIPDAIIYGSGLILVFLSGSVFIKLRFILFSVGSWLSVFIYSISALVWHVDFVILISNVFFFSSAVFISMFAAYNNEKFNRQNFNLYLQIARKNSVIRDINKSLEEKVKERTKLLNARNIDLREEVKRRAQIQEELVIAKEKAEESDKLKSAFLANMSHEIRTPMNGILGFANLLREAEDEKELNEFIDIIISNGEHLLNLINDIIDLSKIEAGIIKIEKSEFNLNVLTKEIYNMFSSDKYVVSKHLNLSYSNGLTDADSVIYTDRVRLKQIIINLVSNACKYTDEGDVFFNYTLKNHVLKFTVKDTGIGIKEEQQPYIFDRFMQASTNITSGRESTGLGLAITKTYLKLMGGNVKVKSEINVGSEFTFTLPVKNNKQPNQ